MNCIRAAHLLSILSSDANEADRLGRILCCDWFGSPVRKQSYRGKDSQSESRFGMVLVNRGGRDGVWYRETMFSQLAKRSPCVVVSG